MNHGDRDEYKDIQDPSGKIHEKEPVFLIRGQDKVGGAAVRVWAELAKAAGASDDIVQNALKQAKLMDHWAENHGKVPDMS